MTTALAAIGGTIVGAALGALAGYLIGYDEGWGAGATDTERRRKIRDELAEQRARGHR